MMFNIWVGGLAERDINCFTIWNTDDTTECSKQPLGQALGESALRASKLNTSSKSHLVRDASPKRYIQ